MKKFEMPEIQVVTFEEEIMSLSTTTGNVDINTDGTTGSFTPTDGWF